MQLKFFDLDINLMGYQVPYRALDLPRTVEAGKNGWDTTLEQSNEYWLFRVCSKGNPTHSYGGD